MSEETIVRFCAPTLADLKAGSLFSCRFAVQADLVSEIRALNGRLRKRGLRVVPLRYRNGLALVYVFRPGRLSCDLGCPMARRLLAEAGYSEKSADRCLGRLARRLREAEEFPHEIGLFLGYPPSDVKGFVDRREAKCCGYWKVYGDVDEAQRTFARFRRCTENYLCRLRKGAPLESLAV